MTHTGEMWEDTAFNQGHDFLFRGHPRFETLHYSLVDLLVQRYSAKRFGMFTRCSLWIWMCVWICAYLYLSIFLHVIRVHDSIE